MNFKEFFKPNAKKIIIFTILFIIFVPFINFDTGIGCIKAPCNAGETGSLLTFLFSSYKFYIYYINYFNLVIGLIISYLISCLIVFVYNKFKEKKK